MSLFKDCFFLINVLIDSSGIQTLNRLVRKRTLDILAKLDIWTIMEYRFTLKQVRGMIITYSQKYWWLAELIFFPWATLWCILLRGGKHVSTSFSFLYWSPVLLFKPYRQIVRRFSIHYFSLCFVSKVHKKFKAFLDVLPLSPSFCNNGTL